MFPITWLPYGNGEIEQSLVGEVDAPGREKRPGMSTRRSREFRNIFDCWRI